jgi:hypothetical protein
MAHDRYVGPPLVREWNDSVVEGPSQREDRDTFRAHVSCGMSLFSPSDLCLPRDFVDYEEHEELEMKNEPNKAMEPIPVDVTIPAAQEVAPSTFMAHL